MRHTLYTGEKPTLQQLLVFPGPQKKIKVHEQIGIKYYELGAFLLDDDTGAIVKAIAQEYSNNADNINKEILSKWLQGMGKQPVTWNTLIEVLRDIDLNSLANDVESSGIFSSTTSSQSVDEEDTGHKISSGNYMYVPFILQVDFPIQLANVTGHINGSYHTQAIKVIVSKCK